MDLGKLSLIVSCLAVILAIPLSILGNILTPRVRDWWAVNTGRQRLEKRIRTLQGRLRVAEESWCFTNAEWEMYEDSYWNKYLCLFGGALLVSMLLTMLLLQTASLGFSGSGALLLSHVPRQAPSNNDAELMAQTKQVTTRVLKMALVTSKGIVVLNLLLAVIVVWREIVHTRNEANHSEKGREEIRKRIDTLNQKLSGSLP